MTKTTLVAKAIILDKTGKFLLMNRSETHPRLAHFADLPGGTTEADEEPGSGVKREVFEETGLKINNLIPVYAMPIFTEGINYPTLLYAVRLEEEAPSVQLSWEHESYTWTDISELGNVEPQLESAYGNAMTYLVENKILESL